MDGSRCHSESLLQVVRIGLLIGVALRRQVAEAVNPISAYDHSAYESREKCGCNPPIVAQPGDERRLQVGLSANVKSTILSEPIGSPASDKRIGYFGSEHAEAVTGLEVIPTMSRRKRLNDGRGSDIDLDGIRRRCSA